MHLRCEGGHAEPKAFLEVEISLLLVILILLHVVLRRKGVSANLWSAAKKPDRSMGTSGQTPRAELK